MGYLPSKIPVTYTRMFNQRLQWTKEGTGSTTRVKIRTQVYWRDLVIKVKDNLLLSQIKTTTLPKVIKIN